MYATFQRFYMLSDTPVVVMAYSIAHPHVLRICTSLRAGDHKQVHQYWGLYLSQQFFTQP